MPLDFVQVDAFTSRPFTGNPAAVCILHDLPHDSLLQDVAREMNLSETAFLLPHEDGYDLRWFTPTAEVDLCGHATLASAHMLWEDGHLPMNEVARFHTRSGLLTARRTDEGIAMDFPVEPAIEEAAPPTLIRAIGAEPVWAGRSRFDWLIELADEKTIRTLSPDLHALAALDSRGIIVTSEALSSNRDFVSRFFAPRLGIPEDPVTGSAHCTLAAHWAPRLGRTTMLGYQVSARGGSVGVRLEGDRVTLTGDAVTVLRGTILV